LTLEDIKDYLAKKAGSIKKKDDTEHKKRTGPLKMLPAFMITILSDVINFLTTGLGLSIKSAGITPAPFGTAIVTSVGMLGIKNGTAPHNILSKVPVMVTVNSIEKKPVVIENKIEIRDVMIVNTVVDHRYVDGGRAFKLNKLFCDIIENA